MARRLPIYSTFQPGELERELKTLALKTCAVTDAPDGWKARRLHRFHLKHHECEVLYPDGSSGTCFYTRHSPECHTLRYEWGEPSRFGTRESLPVVSFLEPLGRDVESVEAKMRELAASAFRGAIWQERKDAMRVQPPWTGHGPRKADPKLYTLSRERAIQLAGRYALCARLEPSGKLLAASATFEALEEVNAAWRERGNPKLVVAIACRWARRWMEVKFNDSLNREQEQTP
jgi:hypothetical protein